MISPTGREHTAYDEDHYPISHRKRYSNGDLLVVKINPDYQSYNWRLLREIEGQWVAVAKNGNVDSITHAQIGAAAFLNPARTVD